MIGIIPAAGRGTRAGGLPYPKELLPVKAESDHMLTVIEGAIQQLSNAEVDRAIIVIRPEKQVIADYLGNHRYGVELIYREQRTMHSREGLPDAVMAGSNLDEMSIMLMGDTYFTHPYAVRDLLHTMKTFPKAVAGVGTWFTGESWRFGIVTHHKQEVISVEDKPKHLFGRYEHWGVAAFRSAFWAYLQEELFTFSHALDKAAKNELVVSQCMRGEYLDFGDPQAIIENILTVNA